MRANKYFQYYKASPYLLLVTAVIAVLLINLIDQITGPELSTSIFYLLPVGLVAWFISRRVGIIFAIASALFWLLTDITTNTTVSHALIPVWNALVRLGFFLIVVWSITSLRRTREKEQDLTSFVVHDLRAPLGNMLIALEMLRGQVDELNSPASAELLDISLASGQRMSILVNTILDLARLKGGKMPVNREEIELTALFKKAEEQVRILALYKGITFSHPEEVKTLSATADPALIERVLVNLLTNAIKFSPHDGQIHLSAAQNAGHILVGIQDSGPGIPHHLEKHIFSRFGQVEEQKNGKSAGTGLGLSFCKAAIEAQNGRIWLEPNQQSGTLIRFTLPAA